MYYVQLCTQNLVRVRCTLYDVHSSGYCVRVHSSRYYKVEVLVCSTYVYIVQCIAVAASAIVYVDYIHITYKYMYVLVLYSSSCY